MYYYKNGRSAFKKSNQYRSQNNGDNRLLSNLSACYHIVETITAVRYTRIATVHFIYYERNIYYYYACVMSLIVT